MQSPPRIMADVCCHRNCEYTFWMLSCEDGDEVVPFLGRGALKHLNLVGLCCGSSVCQWSGRRIQFGVVGCGDGGGLLFVVMQDRMFGLRRLYGGFYSSGTCMVDPMKPYFIVCFVSAFVKPDMHHLRAKSAWLSKVFSAFLVKKLIHSKSIDRNWCSLVWSCCVEAILNSNESS